MANVQLSQSSRFLSVKEYLESLLAEFGQNTARGTLSYKEGSSSGHYTLTGYGITLNVDGYGKLVSSSCSESDMLSQQLFNVVRHDEGFVRMLNDLTTLNVMVNGKHTFAYELSF